MRKIAAILFALICLTFHAFCADAKYKFVRIETLTNAVRVRLPLTDVTGKVRVKEKSSEGFGRPVAPSKVSLGKKHYLEWQIGYDLTNTNSPSVVPEIRFLRNGETKYGHELSKMVLEAVRLGLISTNLDRLRSYEHEQSQRRSRNQIPPQRRDEIWPRTFQDGSGSGAPGFDFNQPTGPGN